MTKKLLSTLIASLFASAPALAQSDDPMRVEGRATLGGIYISVSLLVPLVAARAIAVEHERRSLRVLLLQTAAPMRLLITKYLAALLGGALLLLPMAAMLLQWCIVGGHLHAGETLISLLGHILHLAFLTALACAAAAWTGTVAQAATLTLLCVLASWGIDAAEGFAALAWLGGVADWSITAHLHAFEHGILNLGDCAWLATATTGALALSYVGLRFDWARPKRSLAVLLILFATTLLMRFAGQVPRAFDCTEGKRASLPPAAEAALRAVPMPIALTVFLDRDDARRRQIEQDVLSKLRLARPDVRVTYPPDRITASTEAARDEGYGRILVCAGVQCKETYSASRKELVTLIFEAANQPLPDWSQPSYPGYPLVIEGRARSALLWGAYVAIPALFCGLGLWMTIPRRRRRK